MSDLLLPVYGSRTRYLSSRAVRWLVVFMVACAAQLRATEYVNESFRGTNAAEWVFVAGQGDGPSLTAARAIDGVGDGWLRLTDDLQNQSSFVYYTNTVPTTNGLLITFDFAIWTTENRPAADGFAFAVFAPVETPEPGGYGGSLGYAQRFAIGGLDEAIVGFGFDAHGNFSAPTEGRVGGPGRRRNSIAIRGPMGEARDEGYEYITGTGSLDAFFTQNQASRDNVTIHSVRISISPDKAASVAWTDGDGGWERLIWEDCDIPCPENVMIGFTAGTGGSRANHEIRDLIVSSHTSESFVWDGGSAVDAHWGTDENWLDDDGPGFGATADLVFSTPDADRLDNFLGAERIVRTLTFPSNSAPAAVTLRTTTSATGTDAANLVFAAEGDGAAVILRKGMTNHVTIGNGGGNLVLSNSLFVAHHGTGDLTFGRPVTGIGGLTKTGSGSLTLSAANTYAGNSTLLGGVITLAASGTLGGTGNDLFVWDGTLDLGGTLQTKATVRLYDGALTNGTLTVNSRFHFHGGEFDAVLQGNGGVDKWDSATTLTLGQDNSYNGTTVVRAGTLLVNNPGATGSGTGAGAVTDRGWGSGDFVGRVHGDRNRWLSSASVGRRAMDENQ